MSKPQISPGSTRRIPSRAVVLPTPSSPAEWMVCNPQGLIVGESVDPLGWRVRQEGADLLVSAPSFALAGTGYQARLEAEGGTLMGEFDVENTTAIRGFQPK